MCYFVCLGLNGRIRLYQSRISYRRADQHSLSWTPQILIIYSDDQGGVWIICAEFERCWHGSNIETMGARTVSKRLGIIFWHATRSMRSLHCNGGENVERIWENGEGIKFDYDPLEWYFQIQCMDLNALTKAYIDVHWWVAGYHWQISAICGSGPEIHAVACSDRWAAL